MKISLSILIIAVIFCFSNLYAQHFQFEITDENMSVLIREARIGEQMLENGDEVGCFTEGGVCAGAAVVDDGLPVGIAAFGVNDEDPGFEENELMAFRFWDEGTETEINAIIINDDGFLRYEQNGFAIINLSADIQPGMIIEQDNLNLGPVEAGQAIGMDLLIGNDGPGILRIEIIEVEGEFLSVEFDEEIIVEPDESITIRVTFTPENSGEVEGSISITSNDPENEVIQLQLNGLALDQIITLPRNTELNALPGDGLEFAVGVEDQEENEVSYLWMAVKSEEIDTLGVENIQAVHFEELGDCVVICQTSIRDFTSSSYWNVTAVEYFLNGYTPDSLEVSIRRDSVIDFSLDFRAIEGFVPEYSWAMTDRDGRFINLGEEAVASFQFERRGDYRLVGTVSLEDYIEEIQWDISVNSPIYWWQPHERQFESNIGDQLAFTILPFNPDSDSLEFIWMVDDEVEEGVVDYFQYIFENAGDHSVTAIVHDGAEVDSVIWSVTVIDPDAVDGGLDVLLPREVTLYPAAPNPFNSTTSIDYFLPKAAEVQLSLFDSGGRLVQTLSDEIKKAGTHTATLNGGDLAAGVYLLRLVVSGEMKSLKLVLLK